METQEGGIPMTRNRISWLILAPMIILSMLLAACAGPWLVPVPPATEATKAPKPTEAPPAAKPTEAPAAAKPAQPTAVPAPTADPAAASKAKCEQLARDLKELRGLDQADPKVPQLKRKIMNIIGMSEADAVMLDRWLLRSEVVLLGTPDNVAAFVKDIGSSISPPVDFVRIGDGKPGEPGPDGRVVEVFQLNLQGKSDRAPLSTVGQVVKQARETRDKYQVNADPNYPVQSGGSGTIGGSTWHIGESPYGGSTGVTLPQNPKQAFDDQWAFEKPKDPALLDPWVGIDLEGNSYSPGEGAHVWVFDTAPFPVGQLPSPYTDTVNSVESFLPVLNPTGELCSASDHGLFVASLVKKVAPQSQVHLYPVLDRYGTGDVGDLVTAIRAVTQMSIDKALAGRTVLNLSLGVIPSALVMSPTEPLQALTDAIDQARKSGIVVVAAAGNESAEMVQPLELEYPASDPGVIGVVASNKSGGRSCYSNQGGKTDWWVSAPGGDGGENPNSNAPERCWPRADKCPGKSGRCENGLVGRVVTSTYPSGYAYWSGSSFATPLVSGLAARVLHAKSNTLAGKANASVSDSVWNTVQCGAGGKAGGVINVPVTLSADCLALP
jgi:hypothetical protein